MADRRDSALIELAIDAARVTDDFIRGVLENASGRAGGSDQVDRGWRRFLHLGGGTFSGEKSVVRAMGAQYAPEQLRKAANAADELVAAVHDLAGAWTPPAQDAVARLGALAIDEIPWLLRRPDLRGGSAEVRDVHERLSRTIAALNEARTQAILIEIRRAREQG